MNSFVVFAKEPVPGAVKTRLSPPLTPEEAAGLYRGFVRDVCAAVARASAPGDRRVLAAPGGAGAFLAAVAAEHGFETAAQAGPDLGARMRAALSGELATGARSVVLVGSDSPTLPVELLQEAARRLEATPAGAAAAVIGPSGDGGYWLVGCAGAVPDLFDGIAWSTRDVLAETIARAARAQVDLGLLPFWYDVDDIADLRLLDAHLRWLAATGREAAPATREALAACTAARGGNLV